MEKKYYVVMAKDVHVCAFESEEHAERYLSSWGEAVAERFSKMVEELVIVEVEELRIPLVSKNNFCTFIDYSMFHEDYQAPDESFYEKSETVDIEFELIEKRLISENPEKVVSKAPSSYFASFWDEHVTYEQNMNFIADLFKEVYK